MPIDSSIYSYVRPVPSFLGDLTQIQNLQTGQQHQQLNELEIQNQQQAAAQRAQSLKAQQTIDQLMQQSMGPDGNVDEQKLRQGFVGAGLGHLWGQVDESLTKVKKAHAELAEVLSKKDAEEDEKWAKIGAFSAANQYDPKVTSQTIQETLQAGAVTPARAARYLGQIQQAPTPQTVQTLFEPLVKTSKAQTDIAHVNAEIKAAGELEQDRQQTRESTRQATALANASKQMYQQARLGKAAYTAAWQGLPADLRAKFDGPEQFDPTATPNRALEVSETPDQIRLRTDQEARNADIRRKEEAASAEKKAADANLAEARRDAARHRKWIEDHAPAKTDDAEYKRDFAEYRTFLSKAEPSYSAQLEAWKAQHPYPVPDAQGNFPAPPAYTPPMDFDTWRAAKKGRQASPASTSSNSSTKPAPTALPKGLTVGATVTLKNGKKVVVKAINPDGTITY